jgi:hypothetical protein
MFSACVYLLMGGYIVWYSRRMARDPMSYIARWQSWLPQKQWAYTSVRSLAMFFAWGGLLMIAEAVLEFIPLWSSRTPNSALILFAVLAAVAILITPKQQRRHT